MKHIISQKHTYIGKCPHCDTEFTYNQEDVFFYIGETWVSCPCCKNCLRHSSSGRCSMDRISTMKL